VPIIPAYIVSPLKKGERQKVGIIVENCPREKRKEKGGEGVRECSLKNEKGTGGCVFAGLGKRKKKR